MRVAWLLLLLGCSSTGTERLVLTVDNFDWQGWVPETEKALAGLKGVASFEVRYVGGNRGSVLFHYRKGETTADDLVRSVEKANPLYRVAVGEPDRVPEPPSNVDFRIISSGGTYEIEPNLVRGKVTVLQFAGGADFGDARLDRLAQKFGVALRKVIAVGEAARQLQSEFGNRELPYFRVYGRDGRLTGEAATLDDLESVLKR